MKPAKKRDRKPKGESQKEGDPVGADHHRADEGVDDYRVSPEAARAPRAKFTFDSAVSLESATKNKMLLD